MGDILAALEVLVPDAKFSGAIVSNTKAEYDALLWEDLSLKPAWEEVAHEADVLELETVKNEQIDLISDAAEQASLEPVKVPVRGEVIFWAGGWQSAIKLDAAWRLAMIFNSPTVTFHDVNGISHVLNHEEAEVVIKSIGYAYEKVFSKKASLILQIKNITLDAAISLEESIQEVKNIQW